MLNQSDKMYLRAKMYIPINQIDPDDLKTHYDHHRYDDAICRQCEFRTQRYSDECGACEKGGYLGNVRTWGVKNVKGEQYAVVPIGDRLKVEKKLGIEFSQFKVVDLRTTAKMKHGIKFKKGFKLKPQQRDMVDDWLEYLHGVLKAPPRTGKTLTSLYTVIKLGQKTVIVANQRDYLKNFIEELEHWTNVKDIIATRGKVSYGWLKDDERDYKNFDIGIITYQSLISDKNGKKRRSWINKYFGCVWIDEIHKANATEFSKLVSSLRVKYKGGCTATDKRKDKKHFLMQELIGPVVSTATIETLTPTVYVHETPDVKPKSPRAYQHRGPSAWTGAMKFLATHDRRNNFIIDQILEDLEDGRSIVCPVYFKYHSDEIVKTVNKEWGSEIAVQFVGGGNAQQKKRREQMIADARSGKVRLVCGTRSLLQVGLNVPRWDTHYYAMPMSNKPNWEQESARILTPPSEGMDKKPPIIRMFVDPELGQSIGCFRSTWRFSQQMKFNFDREAIQWYSENVGMSRQEREEASEGMSEYEANELNRQHAQKRTKKKQQEMPKKGFLFRSGKKGLK